jgi:hypothetical protein
LLLRYGNLLQAGEAISKTYVNALIRDVVRMFKRAVSRELIPVRVDETLTKKSK